MWEPFTERSRRVMVLAQEEAQSLGNDFIGTEHILLGIISQGESLAAKVLETLGVDLAKVRAEVVTVVGRGVAGRGGQTIQHEMVFTPRAKRVIELAFEEARQLNHNYIGTEHLLLGIIREVEGVAARVLANLGVDPVTARTQAMSLRETEPQAEPSPSPRAATHIYSRAQTASPESSLTPAARHALIAATEAAQRFGSPVCTVPHLLFGIAHVEGSMASHLLGERGITAVAVERRLRADPSTAPIDEGEIALSPPAQASISSAIAQARGMGRRKANAEHLLLAILGGEETDGSRLLQTLGVDLAELARALDDYLKGHA